jgi:hypothetical protein
MMLEMLMLMTCVLFMHVVARFTAVIAFGPNALDVLVKLFAAALPVNMYAAKLRLMVQTVVLLISPKLLF